jgi:hypothetical protein
MFEQSAEQKVDNYGEESNWQLEKINLYSG